MKRILKKIFVMRLFVIGLFVVVVVVACSSRLLLLVVVVVVVVWAVSRRPVPWHGWWHAGIICWRVVCWQKRSAVTGTLHSIYSFIFQHSSCCCRCKK